MLLRLPRIWESVILKELKCSAKQNKHAQYDAMLQAFYKTLDQDLFTINHNPEPIIAY